MEINNRASIDIMGFSLCLDDSNGPTNNLPTTANVDILAKNKQYNNLSNKTYLNSMNTNSFYIANEEDAVDGLDDEFLFSNRHGIPFQRNHISTSNNNRDIKNLYVSSSNVPINKINTSNGSSINASIDQQVNQINSSNSNITELDNVKHKLSSFWNNVKYGWTRYIKLPTKLDSDSNEPVCILGKKFYINNERSDETNTQNNFKQIGSSSFYDYFDASSISPSNQMSSFSESFIAPSSLTNTNDYVYADFNSINKNYDSNNPTPSISINNLNLNDDYSALNYSFLSTSPSQQFIPPNFKLNNSSDNQQQQQQKPVKISANTKLINESMKTPLEQELYSRLWFTYRKDFEPLNGNFKYTSDCGWGCMLRSAQMLLAQGFLLHFFGKEWSLYKSLNSNKDCNLYKEIISLFNDRPSQDCPFGLHRLLEIADKKLINEDKNSKIDGESSSPTRVGTWFGPTSVCLLVKDALNESYNKNKLLENIRIYVAQDCTIFKKDIIDLCTNKSNNEFIPCMILVSVRLGGEELNDIYVESLKMFLEMENCIGMIGGKPKHSLYFIGYQGEKVVYLDPHTCQPTVYIYPPSINNNNNNKNITINTTKTDISLASSLSSKCSYEDAAVTAANLSSSITSNSSDSPIFENFDNSSYHCANPSTVSFTKLDPSLAIGFYCKNLKDLDDLCDLIKKTSNSDILYPIFGVSDDTFEQAQLNYQSFSIDDKMNTSTLADLNNQNNTDSIFPIENSVCSNINNNNTNNRPRTSSNRASNNLSSVKASIGSYLTNKINSKLNSTNSTRGSLSKESKSNNKSLSNNALASGNSSSSRQKKSSKHKDEDFVLV